MNYETILDDAKDNLSSALQDDLSNDEFNWNKLINLLLVEDSPLLDLFSSKTVKLAELYEAADRLYHTSVELNTLGDSDA